MRNSTEVGASMRPLFAMNAEFLIAESATAGDLHTDISALLEPIRATLDAVAGELSEDGPPRNVNQAAKMLYGVIHLLDMVDGMNNAALSLHQPEGVVSTSLAHALAYAMALDDADRVELSEMIDLAFASGLELEPASILRAGDSGVRELFGVGVSARSESGKR
jgi:hypothetical protein